MLFVRAVALGAEAAGVGLCSAEVLGLLRDLFLKVGRGARGRWCVTVGGWWCKIGDWMCAQQIFGFVPAPGALSGTQDTAANMTFPAGTVLGPNVGGCFQRVTRPAHPCFLLPPRCCSPSSPATPKAASRLIAPAWVRHGGAGSVHWRSCPHAGRSSAPCLPACC